MLIASIQVQSSRFRFSCSSKHAIQRLNTQIEAACSLSSSVWNSIAMADATKLGGLTLGAVAATAVASAVVASVATCALLHTATRGYPCRASSREKAGSSGPAGLNWVCRVVTGRQRSGAHMPEGVQLGSASSGSPNISCCSPRQSSGDEASCMAPGCCTPPRLGSTGRSGGGPRMEGDDTVHFTPQQQQFGTPVALRGTRRAHDTSTATVAGWQQQQQQRQAWPQEQRQQHQNYDAKSCLHVSGLLPLASPMLQPKRDPFDPQPREGYLSWDDYFMALAFLSAERSKDPNKQVGACIVDQNHVIIGIGYNGFPRGCPDGVLPWSKKAHDGDMLGTKYPYVVHAEANALLNKNTASVEGASVYVTMFPCNECAKLLIQAGIREVVYHEAKIQTSCQQDSAGQLSATSVSLSIVAAADDASAAVSTKPHQHQQQAAADESAGTVGETRVEPDPCYLASMRLLQLAGIRLRQHRLQRSIVLGCS